MSNAFRLKLAILSVALLTVTAGAAISPVLADLAIAFPKASATTIKLVLTLPSIAIIPFIFVSSRLTRRFPKKQILAFGMLFYLIGGVGAGFVSTIEMLLVYRLLLGIGAGLIMPISTSLVADFFEGEERTATMGQVSAVNNLSGVILFIASGFLATISWRAAFNVYFIVLAVAIIVFLFLPRNEPDRTEKTADSMRLPIPKKVYVLSGAIFFLVMAFFSIPVNMALFMQQEGIGQSQHAGIVTSLGPAIGFISGLLLRRVKKVFGSSYLVMMLLFMAIGFFIIGQSHHTLMLGLGVGMMGFGFGSLFPMVLDEVSRQVPKTQTVQAMAVVTSMIFFSQFFSPLMLDGVRFVFLREDIRFSFQVLSSGYVLAAVVFCGIMLKKDRLNKKQVSH